MKYKQIKWLILITPTITIALWEYVRHEFLLPYISMDMGNYLSPILVFIVTLVFLRHLFSMLERIQEELRVEKTKKAALEEREKLARELHDGIAQSLFLLSVKTKKFIKKNQLEYDPDLQKIEQTLQHVHEDTRQAITNLRYIPNNEALSWTETINQFVSKIKDDHIVDVHLDWSLNENILSPKEKVELFACIKEAVMNVIKHAKTNQIWIHARETDHGWICQVIDQGIGFTDQRLESNKSYGLDILKNRARDMEWEYTLKRIDNETIMTLMKEQM